MSSEEVAALAEETQAISLEGEAGADAPQSEETATPAPVDAEATQDATALQPDRTVTGNTVAAKKRERSKKTGGRKKGKGSGNGGVVGGGGGGGGDSYNRAGLDSSSANASYSTQNLYIRGLSPQVTDKSLYDMCSSYGSITSAKAIVDKNNGCRGYGFVMFDQPLAAAMAVQELAAEGVSVSFAKLSPRYPSTASIVREDPTNLYFSNLPFEITESKLEELLLPFGEAVSSRILRNTPSMSSRGVGFARMQSRDVCLAAIQAMDGTTLEGSVAPLLVKFADNPVHPKRAQFQQQRLDGPADPSGFVAMTQMMGYPSRHGNPMALNQAMMMRQPLPQLGLQMLPVSVSGANYLQYPQADPTTLKSLTPPLQEMTIPQQQQLEQHQHQHQQHQLQQHQHHQHQHQHHQQYYTLPYNVQGAVDPNSPAHAYMGWHQPQ